LGHISYRVCRLERLSNLHAKTVTCNQQQAHSSHNSRLTRPVELFFAFGYVKNISIFVTSKLKALINCKKFTTVAYENNENNDKKYDNDRKMESIYSKRIRAGKRRTYFFDVRATRGNDYYLTITESRKRFDDNGYDRHKIFLYKEDFNKFIRALGEAVDYVKTDLMPDFDFDAFNHDENPDEIRLETSEKGDEIKITDNTTAAPVTAEVNNTIAEEKVAAKEGTEEVDKW
jgi:hypothetical protein